MTSSPDLIHELRASRPSAPADLRARVRVIAAEQPRQAPWASWRIPVRRGMLVAVPAAAALAFASAGVLGLARSDGPQALRQAPAATRPPPRAPHRTRSVRRVQARMERARPPTRPTRAQRVSATLTVEVADPDAVSRAAQDALDLTRSLGGYVVSSSVATGEEGSASLTVRVPVDEGAGRDRGPLRARPDRLAAGHDRRPAGDARRARRSVRRRVLRQIARIPARLDSETLDAADRGSPPRRGWQTSASELRALRTGISATEAEARMSTIQLTVVTPGAFGAVAPPSRIDRTIDEALNVLAWEGVVALGLLIVLAPFALVALRRVARAPALPPPRGRAAARDVASRPRRLRVAARASRSAPPRRP